MKKFVLSLLLCGLSTAASAESSFEQAIRLKQEAAAQKRQQAEAIKSDPEAYVRAKYAATDDSGAGERIESFKVSGDGHYYIPVSLNNRSVNFMADTGASAIFMSQSDAKKVGINTQTLQYNQSYTTANGAKGRAATATAKTLKIGSIQMQNIPVVVSMESNHIALLGMEFFRRLKRYEVADGEMKLYK